LSQIGSNRKTERLLPRPFAEKQAYFRQIQVRYQKASKKEKGRVLDEFCAVCGYQRKYAIRKLNQPARMTPRRKPGPGRVSCYQQPQFI